MKILDAKTGYDQVASQYREYYEHLDSFDWDEAQKAISRLMSKFGQEEIAIADLGCGDGRVIGRLYKSAQKLGLKANWFGFDISPAMIRRAQKKHREGIEFFELDFTGALPQKYLAKFDLVTAMFFLVHMPKLDDFLDQSSKILVPGGTLVFNTFRQPDGFGYGEGGQKFAIKWYDHKLSDVQSSIEAGTFTLLEHISLANSDIFTLQKPY